MLASKLLVGAVVSIPKDGFLRCVVVNHAHRVGEKRMRTDGIGLKYGMGRSARSWIALSTLVYVHSSGI